MKDIKLHESGLDLWLKPRWSSKYSKDLTILVISPDTERLQLLFSGWPSPFFANSGSEKALPLLSLPNPQCHVQRRV